MKTIITWNMRERIKELAKSYEATCGTPADSFENICSAAIKAFVEQENVVYKCCQKHEGRGWSSKATYRMPPKEVCPICEPPEPLLEMEASCYQEAPK